MTSQREMVGVSLVAVGGFIVVADLLGIENRWHIGVVMWVIGAVLIFWTAAKR